MLLPYNLPRCILKPLTGLANSLKSKVSSYLSYHAYGVRGTCIQKWYGANGLIFKIKKKLRKISAINIRITKYS